MAKYFLLALIFGMLSMGLAADNMGNHAAIGFGVSAGLCVLAAAVAEQRSKPKQ